MTAAAIAPVVAAAAGDTLLRDRRLGRRVVVERPAETADEATVERFLAAARLQGRLEHPAIVPVLDVGRDRSGAFVTLRRVEGVDLATVIGHRSAGDRAFDREFTQRRLLEAFVAVCLAVEYAHVRGIVHRELRAHDDVLGGFGEVYVQGWRRAAAATGGDGAAPRDTTRDDLAALGRVLFELLCHRELPPGADVHVEARTTGRPVAPELLDACASATTAGREPPGARGLAEAVQRWLDGARDQRRRRELAARHLDRARAAMIAEDPTVAMREASSAVALDPADAAAADLLGRMVLEPPPVDDTAAAAAVLASDHEELRAEAALAARSYLAIPLFLPLLWVLGVKQVLVPVAIAAVAAFEIGLCVAAQRGRGLRTWGWVSLLGNVVMLALFSRLFSPVLAVPAMCATLGMTALTVPGLRPWWGVPLVLAVPVFGPLVLEELGWIASSTVADGQGLVITSSVIELPGATLAVLALHTIALTVVAANYMRQLTQVNRAARARLLSQAWHLEQLASAPSE